jgi:ATP-dependent Clp protease ATP-binding subunit ClpA
VENSEYWSNNIGRIKNISKDKALERRFQKIIIEEPDTESAISILRGIKEKIRNTS